MGRQEVGFGRRRASPFSVPPRISGGAYNFRRAGRVTVGGWSGKGRESRIPLMVDKGFMKEPNIE